MGNDSYKLLFIGAPGAGKTTCVAALSDIPPLNTDVPCSGDLARIKDTTTVAMDYGEMNLAGGVRLLLYGLPGQIRFRFMFEAVSDGLVGVIILADAANRDCVTDLDAVLSEYAAQLRSYPCILALNKCREPAATLQSECAAVLRRHGIVAPQCVVDARQRQDIAGLFQLLYLLLEAEENAMDGEQ